MEWTVKSIAEFLHEKPELKELVRIIHSFPAERQAEAIRTAAEFLESKKAPVDSGKAV